MSNTEHIRFLLILSICLHYPSKAIWILTRWGQSNYFLKAFDLQPCKFRCVASVIFSLMNNLRLISNPELGSHLYLLQLNERSGDIVLVTGHRFQRDLPNFPPDAFLAERIVRKALDIEQKFRKLRLDEAEFVCFKYLIVFNAGESVI